MPILTVNKGAVNTMFPLERFFNSLQKALYRLSLYWHCHQRPDRSFFVFRRQIPLCARCLGLIIGVVLCPISLILPEYFRFLRFCWLILALDGITQYCGLRESSNVLRFFTGFSTTFCFPLYFGGHNGI